MGSSNIPPNAFNYPFKSYKRLDPDIANPGYYGWGYDNWAAGPWRVVLEDTAWTRKAVITLSAKGERHRGTVSGKVLERSKTRS